MAITEIETRLSAVEQSLGERIGKLEEQVSHLKEQLEDGPLPAETASWKGIIGIFKDDPLFDEAMRLGAEYREGLRNEDEQDEGSKA